MTKKRVMMTVEKEPYESLMANAKKAGLPKYWLGREMDKLIGGLNGIVEELARVKESGQKLSDEEMLRKIVETAEKAFGMKIKDIMK